jgi:SAM-dependent MidA family methyltransferase
MERSLGSHGSLERGVVIANELLDNLAFRVLDRGRDGSWSEVFVEVDDRTGAVTERLLPASEVPELFAEIVAGRVPWLASARRWVDDVLARRVGRLVVLDYGLRTTSELVRRGGWLRTYRQHQRGADPYDAPGQWDITTDVPFDQLPSPRELGSQADFLRRFGIEDLVDEGRRYWREHASRPDLPAIRMRSRIREAEALLDPAGLGAWLVASWAEVD